MRCAWSRLVASGGVSLLLPLLLTAATGPDANARAATGPDATARAATARPPAPLGPTPNAAQPHRPAPPPKILPLSEVRPGMVGEAFTVFHGTEPEPFKVRVISVMRKFLPEQDVILIRAEDPRVELSGIVAGMSGSPVYVDGKLMGAIAYAWSFSKEPIGGVTPIESMLADRSHPRRIRNTALADARDGLEHVTIAEGGPADGAGDMHTPMRAGNTTWTGDWPVPPDHSSRAVPAPFAEPRLVPVAVPLSVSGFDPRVLGDLAHDLGIAGVTAVQAGGGRPPSSANTVAGAGAGASHHLVPGSAIGVEMIRGDMSMVGTGTVTYIDGTGVLAFGHPMFGVGEIYLPLVEAEIHTVLSSLAQSMKLSSPLGEVGSLVQDRPSCIVGDLGARATMVPVAVRVTSPGSKPKLFHAEVARNLRLTPVLASLVVASAIADSEPDVADMSITVVSKLALRGRGVLELRDEIFSPEGVARQLLGSTRGLRAVGDLLSNPFEPVILDGLDVDVTVERKRDIAEIVGVSSPGDSIRPGDTVKLRVTLRPYSGPEYVETIPVVIPNGVGGDTVRIEAASGALAKPDMPPAETLPVYLDNLKRYFAPSSIVVSIQTSDDGAALRGRLLPDLPSVASDTLRPANQTRRADPYRVAARTVVPAGRLVFGRQDMTIFVRDDVLGDRKAANP